MITWIYMSLKYCYFHHQLVNSMLAVTPAELLVVGCDPRGSHVVDAFVNSISISIKNKEKLIYKFKVNLYNCGIVL